MSLLILLLSLVQISCAEHCYNNFPCCAGWAANGYCEENKFVKSNCRAACEVCTPSYTLDSDGTCTDYMPSCGGPAGRGRCAKARATFMEENCRKTCDKCDQPRHLSCPESPPDCGKNMKFQRSCGGSCELACTISGEKVENCQDSKESCKLECRCKPGYIKDHTGENCILPEECIDQSEISTTTKKPEKQCGKNEEYVPLCGNCDDTCDDDYGPGSLCWDDEEMFTGEDCQYHCACKDGYVGGQDMGCMLPEEFNKICPGADLM